MRVCQWDIYEYGDSSTEVFVSGGICETRDLYGEERGLFKGKIYQRLRDLSPVVLVTEIYKCGELSTVKTV